MTRLHAWLDARLALARAALRAPGRRTRRGMTLMEVMIVIVIILLLMGTLAFGLQGLFGQAQSDSAMIMIQKIDQRITLYKAKKRKLPESIEELFKGEEQPRDPWGNAFVYRKGGGPKGYDIISYGADGKEGGDDDVKLSTDM